MKQIYVHGLGQTPMSWDKTLSKLSVSESVACPDLTKLIQHNDVSYHNLYDAFASFCNGLETPIDLCGLSLGGVLALNYAIDYPENIQSLVLIAAPYRMPKRLLQFQNIVFRLMPEKAFQQTGFGKSDFIQLCRTMIDLDFSQSIHKISCRSLVICGEKDFANKKICHELSSKLKNSKFLMLDGVGHEVNVEAHQELAEILKHFYYD